MKIYVSPSSQEANVGPGGYVEEKYMNLVADILCPELTRHGIDWMRNKITNKYYDHVAESNSYKPDYHIALHTNAGGGHGCTSFCFDAADKTRKGTQMATKLFNQITFISPWPGRGVASTTMDEVEKTNAAACLIEIEFHDNVEGATWIMNHIPEIAQAILLGILEQCGIAYIPPVVIDYKALYEAQLAANKTLYDQITDMKNKLATAESAAISAEVKLQKVREARDTILNL